MTLSIRVLALLTTVGGVLLGACGSSTASIGPTDAASLQNYANNTDNLTSFHFSLTENVSSQGQNLVVKATGVEQVSSSGPNLEMQITSPALGGTETTIVDNGVAYLHVPPTQQSPAVSSSKWYEISLPKSGLSSTGPFLGGQSADPLQFASILKETSGTVKQLGKHSILGKETLEYSGHVNLKNNLNKLPSNLTTAIKGAGGLIPSVLSFNVWVDSSGRIRQLNIPVDTSVGNVDLTMDFYHDGTPVTITPPPASDTTKVPYSAISGQG